MNEIYLDKTQLKNEKMSYHPITLKIVATQSEFTDSDIEDLKETLLVFGLKHDIIISRIQIKEVPCK